MRDIAQVLRRKRAQHAQLTKEIQLLEDVEQKLQEVAALLADGEEEESSLLNEVEEDARPQAANAMAAAASGGTTTASGQIETSRPTALRWP